MGRRVNIRELEWCNTHACYPMVVDIYAVGWPKCSDCELVRTGGLFWELRDDVKEWLRDTFSSRSYEIRLNDLIHDLYNPVPLRERVITHHTYILMYGDDQHTPMQQAMMFKLVWGGEFQ